MIHPPAGTPGPDLGDLLSLFPATADDIAACEVLPVSQGPPADRALLDHEDHMTITMEARHGAPVEVCVLDRKAEDHLYARRIVLTLHGSDRIVLYGLVIIDFRFCDPEVRSEIVAEKTPLGRVLIRHNVMRRIEPTSFVRVRPGPNMARWFEVRDTRPCFGRLAYIHCNDLPAIELLEVSPPEGPG